MGVAAVTAGFSALAVPREQIWGFLAVFALSAVVLGAALWWAREALWSLPWKRALVLVLVVAALLRVSALVAPISLSDDIWRYLWDGEIVAAGQTPYAESAAERMERGEGDAALYEKINRPRYQTIYPPVAQVVFGAAVYMEQLFGGTATSWLRILFVLFDLMGIAVLGLVLVKLGRSPMWAALYGWHPLAYWEVAAGVHTEALGLVWLAALVGLALSNRAAACGVAIGLAGLAKWTFLVVSPVVALYLLRARGWWAAISTTVAALVVFVGGYLLFWSDDLVTNKLDSLRLYSEHFSFNAPVYYVLRWSLGYEEGVTEPVHHITGPVLTLCTIAVVAAVAMWQDGSVRRFLAGMALAAAGYLLFSAVFHPWYALPFLALGVLAKWTTPAVVCSVVVLSYLFYAPWMSRGAEVALMAVQVAVIGGWALWEFGPPWLERALRRRAMWKADVVDDALDGGEAVLDLGAGEGFVGEELARRGYEVELVDVVDRNGTDLPFSVYDGGTLPFDNDAFDAVVISYVLHHAEDPDRVLAEALRVGRRLVILETVYEKEWDRRLVTVLDLTANALRGMAPEPLKFDTVEGWTERVEELGAEVRSWRWLGRGVHRHVVMIARHSEQH